MLGLSRLILALNVNAHRVLITKKNSLQKHFLSRLEHEQVYVGWITLSHRRTSIRYGRYVSTIFILSSLYNDSFFISSYSMELGPQNISFVSFYLFCSRARAFFSSSLQSVISPLTH
jgi:hypothetical protein